MPYTTTEIDSYIAKAQRAIAFRMTKAVRLEALGNDALDLYLQCRYLSAAVRVLSNENHGLDIDEVEKIIHCMIECGDINDFDSSPLVFPPIVVVKLPLNPIRITDLADGPGGSLAGQELKGLRVNANGDAWEWYSTLPASLVSLKNCVFVSENGDDETGMLDRLDKPFLTRFAAMSAASSGYTVIVFPGSYTDRGLGKAGVNWFTFPGVKNYIDGPLYAGANLSFSVVGDEMIYPPADDPNNEDVQVANFTGTSLVSIEIGGFEASHSGNYVRLANSSRCYLTSKRRIYSIVHPNSNCDCSGSTVLQINTPEIYCSAGFYVHGSTASITINSPRIMFDNDPSDAGNVALTVVYNEAGNITLNGNIIASNALFTSVYGLLHNTSSAGITTVNGNITNGTSSSTTNQVINCGAGTIEVNGNIGGYKNIIVSGGTLRLNGYNALNNGAAAIVSQSGGNMFLTGTMYNLFNNASAHCITKSGGTTYLKYVTLGVINSSAESVNASTAQTVISEYATATTAVNVNITVQGTLLVNANFQ